MKFVICLFMTVAILVASDQKVGQQQHENITLWNEGKIPYELSKQYTADGTNLIKETLIEIMKTTCIKFAPRLSESDFMVFMEYKDPAQERGTCWSGKWSNGVSTVGNRNGRHIVSLWSDLDCFNKFGIIRGLLNIIGLSPKPPTLTNNDKREKRAKLYGCINYEENWANAVEESALGTICRKDLSVIKAQPYALDMQERALAATGESCNVLRNLIDINQLYNCPHNVAESLSSAEILNASNFTSGSPNCKAEADAGTCKSDPVYMDQICEKSFCDETTSTASTTTSTTSTAAKTTPKISAVATTTPKTSTENTATTTTSTAATTKPTTTTASTLPARPSTSDVTKRIKASFAHLRNAHGKCMASADNSDENGNPLIQWDCKAEEKGQQWSWNEDTLGSKDRHICNGHGMCVASPDNISFRTALIQSENLNQKGQKYTFLDSSRPGFYMMKNDFGNCLGVLADDRKIGAEILVNSCKLSGNGLHGQHWQWYKM